MIKAPIPKGESPNAWDSNDSGKDPQPSTLHFPRHLAGDLRSRLQIGSPDWLRVGRFLKGLLSARTFVLVFIGLSGIYAFSIGRSRYTTTSEFFIQQPTPLNSTASSIFGTGVAVPQVINSLVDGQYLSVYLTSPSIKTRLYPKSDQLEKLYAPERPDIFAGLPANSTSGQQLAFFKKQISIQPQPISGSLIIRTTGYQPEQALKLNQSLLTQSQRFVNEVNQSISADQKQFAENELKIAEKNLSEATQSLQDFQDRYGQLSPEVEQQTTSTFIAQLESNLVDLKVELATLKRRYIDPDSPEVAYLADQVQELERQIREERQKAVGAKGRDLNKLTAQSEALKSDVEFASKSYEAARIAVDNSRRESQRQLKFIVMLSKPQLPSGQDMNWRWQFFLASIGIVIVGWAVGGFVVAAIRKE
tara:strand:+ start:497 stop:1753 length:1257 start_codon:yes stop_codon:yes gene_type:complete